MMVTTSARATRRIPVHVARIALLAQAATSCLTTGSACAARRKFTLKGRPEAAWSYAVCNEDCRDEWLREHPDADFPDPHAARVTLTTDAAVWKHISNAVRATRGRSATAADVASDAVLREVSPPACPGIARAADDEVA